MFWQTLVYAALTLLVIIVAWEILNHYMVTEGFTDGVVPEFFGRFFPRRSDVGPSGQIGAPGSEMIEPDGWIRNPRYFEGYVDVQNLGYKADFCRVVEKPDMPESRIMACALAGQEGLDSFLYRTDSQRAGMRFSRDNYFRDVDKDGREDYGRILKISPSPNDRWEARAVLAGLTRFKQGELNDIQDNDPPPDIGELLFFFEGIMVWYRFFDDMLDYAENTQLKLAGEITIDEDPHNTITKGVGLNRLPTADDETPPPADQYMRIGENPKLEFDTKVQLRQLRAVSVWVFFDEFTNNARIFDFGNGAGHDNVLLGIEVNQDNNAFGLLAARPGDDNKVCNTKPPMEMSPQLFLATSESNVNEWECPGPEPIPSTYPEDELKPARNPSANLIFEIWDSQQRVMRLRAMNAIPLKKWTHIALTTTDMTNLRPTWQIYVDNHKVFEQPSGFMPLKSYTDSNFIGRSNWELESQAYESPDERLRGALFDFRLYRQPMTPGKIDKTYRWGHKKLGIQDRPKPRPASTEGFPQAPPQAPSPIEYEAIPTLESPATISSGMN